MRYLVPLFFLLELSSTNLKYVSRGFKRDKNVEYFRRSSSLPLLSSLSPFSTRAVLSAFGEEQSIGTRHSLDHFDMNATLLWQKCSSEGFL